MSNVQEALKAAIEALNYVDNRTGIVPPVAYEKISSTLNQCKAALFEIEKCEPVAYLVERINEDGEIIITSLCATKEQAYENARCGYTETRVIPLCRCNTSPQSIEKCEPVAEALHERNRLGYAVVDVIGALDEIIENAQEVEVDDFLHIAIPIDKWHELQDALEEMPKRAELYTSPQPIDKCAPVYLIVSGADEIVVTKEKYDSWSSAKRISYTSPISKEWVQLTDEQIKTYSKDQYATEQEFLTIVRWTQAKLKQLNAEKG